MNSGTKERLVNVDLVRLGRTSSEDKGKEVFLADYTFSSQRHLKGVAKVFSPELKESATKEIRILKELQSNGNTESAFLLDVRDARELGFDPGGIAILETLIEGNPILSQADPMKLEEVQKRSGNLFTQLSQVSRNESLIAEGIGYCGDISSTNVLKTRKWHFSIVDWGTRLGTDDQTERVTRRYVAPEVIAEVAEVLSFVHADTFSLGCVLFRAIVGKQEYAKIVPASETETHFLSFEETRGYVPVSVHAFFRISLAHNPLERSPDNAKTPKEHFRRLKHLFRGVV